MAWDHNTPFGIALFLFYGYFWAAWVTSFNVTIDKDRFLYQSLFYKTEIKYTSIKSIDRYVVPARLKVLLKDDSRPVLINLKVFSLEDVSKIERALRGKEEAPL